MKLPRKVLEQVYEKEINLRIIWMIQKIKFIKNFIKLLTKKIKKKKFLNQKPQ